QRAVFDSLARVQQAARGGGGRRGERPGVFIERNGAPSRFNGLAPEFDSLMRMIDQSGRAMRAGNALDAREFARRATTLGPPRRVVITEPRLRGTLTAAAPVADALADSLRKVIGTSGRFVLVPPDSVAQALQKTRTIDDLASALGADVFASIQAFRTAGDSVRWQLTLRDLTANPAYSLRSWVSDPSPVTAFTRGVDSLLPRTVPLLSEMDRAPRRAPPDNAPGGPLGKEAFDARAASMGPPRPLIVWTHPPDAAHRDVEAAGTAITDAIRKALGANPRYVVLPTDETLNLLARTRNRDQVAAAAHAELMVTIRGSVQRDSVFWVVTAWDLGAYGIYQQRTVTAGRVPLATPTANADALTKGVLTAIETLDHAPRQTAGARPPGDI
ncbi:MAG TPA: hypothetical protein VG916_13905, partial [Gemmatimonadaceae bacterium]|nr:hypothetical protein [Gemmatimonadaceae bacterium]